ncbi:hypothetical protein [Streptomyces sp. NPDC059881]|uniref:hypothetical protein n=1 Tax=Streptomyces sp. NPDC059881 TaxID=3346986 RepID=UPI003663A0DE
MAVDQDAERLGREELVTGIRRLRAAAGEHRDSVRYDLCRHHPRRSDLLPNACEALGRLDVCAARLGRVDGPPWRIGP